MSCTSLFYSFMLWRDVSSTLTRYSQVISQDSYKANLTKTRNWRYQPDKNYKAVETAPFAVSDFIQGLCSLIQTLHLFLPLLGVLDSQGARLFR